MLDGPQFSIVIPTRDRPEALAACLEACARLDFPREEFEVIVADDGGRTSPAPLTARFADSLQLTLV